MYVIFDEFVFNKIILCKKTQLENEYRLMMHINISDLARDVEITRRTHYFKHCVIHNLLFDDPILNIYFFKF